MRAGWWTLALIWAGAIGGCGRGGSLNLDLHSMVTNGRAPLAGKCEPAAQNGGADGTFLTDGYCLEYYGSESAADCKGTWTANTACTQDPVGGRCLSRASTLRAVYFHSIATGTADCAAAGGMWETL